MSPVHDPKFDSTHRDPITPDPNLENIGTCKLRAWGTSDPGNIGLTLWKQLCPNKAVGYCNNIYIVNKNISRKADAMVIFDSGIVRKWTPPSTDVFYSGAQTRRTPVNINKCGPAGDKWFLLLHVCTGGLQAYVVHTAAYRIKPYIHRSVLRHGTALLM